MQTNRQTNYQPYMNAYLKAVEKYAAGIEKNLPKLILCGVKLINRLPEANDIKAIQARFNVASGIKSLVGELTPAEFMNVFPIVKEYKGHKWGVKDYFYTMDYLATLNMDQPIGDQALEFLMEYTNREVMTFCVKVTCFLSELREHEGHLSVMEEFMASHGMDTPNTFKNSKGEALYVRGGKPVKVKRAKAEKLRVIQKKKA